MTVGIATASANSALDTQLNSLFAQLHTGDPGSAGTNSVSSTTTRISVPFNSAASGSKSLTATVAYAAWAGTAGEVVGWLSLWTASTGGTFKQSYQLTTTRTVQTGDVLQITGITTSLGPLAA